MLGLGLETALEMRQAQMAMFAINENSHAAAARFEEILFSLVMARKAAPADDMTSVIVHHANMASDEERMQAMVVLISAAAQGTMSWIAQVLALMLTGARFSGRMRGGRLGIDDALDEVLWRDPPTAALDALPGHLPVTFTAR
jgi:hypothetical protein